MTTITTNVNQAITLGSGGYDSPLIIDASGSVAPPSGSPDGAFGIYSDLTNGSLTIFGSVSGGAGEYVTNKSSHSGTGGVGVDFTSGTITNYGAINGGVGGIKLVISTSAAYSGGNGVDLAGTASLDNEQGGNITGGAAGTLPLGSAAPGSVGVSLSGSAHVNNTGTITGGAVDAETAGVGVLLQGNSSLTNGAGGSIVGGSLQELQPNKYASSVVGGAGVSLGSGASLTNLAGSSISGGAGYAFGSGGVGLYIAANGGANGSAKNYGSISGADSAAGVSLASNAALFNDGTITAGGGGSPGAVGVQLQTGASLYNAGQIVGGSSSAAAGGAGASVAASATVYNEISGTITGGVGAGNYSGTATAGTGGAGVNLVGAGYVTNQGTIVGGAGGSNGYTPTYTYPYSPPSGVGAAGTGGAGANVVKGSKLSNYGHITGGRGGDSYYTPGGSGGVGVYVNGGTLLNAGTISGGSGTYGGSLAGDLNDGGSGSRGYGASGLAVKFGSVAGTLVVDPGAAFNGNVAGNSAVKDVLQLSGTGGTLSGFGSQFYGFSTLSFAPRAQWTVSGSSAAFDKPLGIQGFALNDTLDLTDLKYVTGATASFSAGVLTIKDGSTSLQLNFANADGTPFYLGTDASGAGTDITLEPQAACYRRGTRILTTRGDVAIERLQIGDLVVTASGARRPIRWLGHRRVTCARHPDPAALWPIRIQAGALAEGVPIRDLWVSPGHSMLIDQVLIQALAIVNDATIEQVPSASVEYWHLELDGHDLVIAEGAAAESYLDVGNRAAFHEGGSYLEAHPDFKTKYWADTCVPLVLDGPMLQDAKRKILNRVGELGYSMSADSDLHVVAAGERIDPIFLNESRAAFIIPPGRSGIELRCRGFTPCRVDPQSADPRRLGVCVSRLQLDGCDLPLNGHEVYTSGWHELEVYGPTHSQRWSKECAPLPDGTQLVVMDLAGRSYCWSRPSKSADSTHARTSYS